MWTNGWKNSRVFSKKIEGREIKLVALAIIIHPILILIFSAIALKCLQGVAAITNPGFHGFNTNTLSVHNISCK